VIRGCYGKILNETNCSAQLVKNSAVRVGQKHFMVNELQPMTAKKCSVTVCGCVYGTEIWSEMVFLMNPAGTEASFGFC